MKFRPLKSVASLLFAASLTTGALADVAAPVRDPAFSRLLSDSPGVHVTDIAGHPGMFYGVPMTEGETPQIAAEQWLLDYNAAFGAGQLSLTLNRANEVNYGKLNVFVYDQLIDGVPVERGAVRLVVLNAPTRDRPAELAHRVVLASARIAQRPAAGFAPDAFSGKDAAAITQKLPVASGFDTWDEPTKVVFFGEGDTAAPTQPARCWKVVGYNSKDHEQSLTFFVNTADGSVVHVRDNVSHADIIGRIQGRATPDNNIAPTPGNTPTLQNIPEIRVSVVNGAGSAYTDASGNFRIPWAGTAPVSLHISVGEGHWVEIQDVAANIIDGIRTNVVPGVNSITNIHPNATEFTLAQVNTFLAQNETHNFFRNGSHNWNNIDIRLPAVVNLDDTCNAFFTAAPLSTNFFREGGGCRNMGWGSVVNHEYGHFIVNRLGLGQGAFGEGFADSCSALINDSPIMGLQVFTDGSPSRDLDLDDRQYPCDGFETHYCGEILGGVIWEMRQAFGDQYGSAPGLAEVKQLFVDWALITAGGVQENSAHPGMMPEWFIADDVDGFLCNGTPNHALIVQAFAARSIAPPDDPFVEDRAVIVVPTTPPELVDSGTAATVEVTITPERGTIIPGSERYVYRTTRTGGWIAVPLVSALDNSYIAQLPRLDCMQEIEYYFAVDTDLGSVAYPTPECGFDYFRMIAVPPLEEQVLVSAFNFETADPSWESTVDDGAVDGRWQQGVPQGSTIPYLVPDIDTTPSNPPDEINVNCWVTKNGPRDEAPELNDVDAGAAILVTGRFDLTPFTDAVLVYNRWFSNDKGTNPAEDVFEAECSGDDGLTWLPVQRIGPKGPNTTGGWVHQSVFSLSFSGVAPTDKVRFRFIARDDFSDSLVEAAIDDLFVVGTTCQLPCDTIDFNRDGLLPDVLDIEDFLSVFGGGPCSNDPNCGDIDFNNDTLFPDIADIETLLNTFAGAPCE